VDVKESYRILELKPGADLDEIKAAYRRMAFKLHPDLNAENPQAATDFQRLNEAYVILKQAVRDETRYDRPRKARKKADTQRAKADAGRAKAGPPPGQEKPGPRQEAKAQSSHTRQRASGAGASQRPGGAGAKSEPPPWTNAGNAGAAQAGAKPKNKRDVIRNIMNDPFARKVFDEIYSHIRTGETKPKGKLKRREVSLKWGDKHMSLDLTGGLFSGVRWWIKRQFDDEQTVYLKPSQLVPGTRLKIQIRRAWTGKPASVELPLPSDYVVGRPIRLKGLGRQFGPFKGDLYIRLLAK